MLCWARGWLFCFALSLSSFLLCFDFRGFLLGFRSFLLERWWQMIILLGSRDWICCLFRVGLAWCNFCVEVSLPGSPVCWAFAVFLLERHGGKFFVELELLSSGCWVFCLTANLIFCFVSRRTCATFCLLLEWHFRSFTSNFHFIFDVSIVNFPLFLKVWASIFFLHIMFSIFVTKWLK